MCEDGFLSFRGRLFETIDVVAQQCGVHSDRTGKFRHIDFLVGEEEPLHRRRLCIFILKTLEADVLIQIPPVFDTSFGGLMITFYNSPAAQLKEAGIDDRGIAVVNYVLAEKKVTNSDVQKLLKVSKPTATRILSSLSDYLVITGTRGKGTYYSIKGLSIGSQLAQ